MAHIEYPLALIEEAQKMGVQLGSGEDYDPSDALETLGDEIRETARMNGDLTPVKWNDDLEDPFAYEADFGGFSFKKLGRGIGRIAKKTVRGVGKVVRSKPFQYAMPGVAAMVGKGPMVELGKKFAPAPLRGGLSLGSGLASKGFDKLTGSDVKKAVQKTVTPQGVVSFGIRADGNVKAAMSAADRLLGDPKVNNAALVVRNTKALAALGDPSAKRGLAVLNAVGTIRTVRRATPGRAVLPKVITRTPVVQKTTPAKVTALAKATAAKRAADAQKETWVQKLLGWFGLEVKK